MQFISQLGSEDISTKVRCSNRKGHTAFASVFFNSVCLCFLGLTVPRKDGELIL